MSINSERVMAWRHNTKLKLIAAFGNKCVICGYNRCKNALEFHHLDPNDKETSWGEINGSIRSWNYICEEMTKCVMLCANCHREVHEGLIEIPESVQRFDQSLIPSELLKIRVKKQKPTRPLRPDRYDGHDLIALYEEVKCYEELGRRFNVSGAAIKRKLRTLRKHFPIGLA